MIAVMVALAAVAATVAEPRGYWTGALQGATPATLRGAVVVDRVAVERALSRPGAVLIDVSPDTPRPGGLPPGAYWAPAHRSIPGSRWLPGAGAGDLGPADAARFARLVAGWTGGDLRRPVIVFCHPRCWASWNAGRRLVQSGHTQVHWFPGGIEAWQERHATVVVPAAW